MHNANAIERAVQISRPEVQKVGQLRKAWSEIEILPDIALQNLGWSGKR